MSDIQPIGVFDSGVGGLSVWREIARQWPHEDTIYFADQIHIPYGPRPLEQIRQFSEAITRFLLDRECKAIVVACNTASAAALRHLRETFPHIPCVGMEPAVKPAAQTTQSGIYNQGALKPLASASAEPKVLTPSQPNWSRPIRKPGMRRPPSEPNVDVPTTYNGNPVFIPKRPGTR